MSLPIYDREKRPMTVGSRFLYLHGTPYEEVLEIADFHGLPVVRWSDGTSRQVEGWWYAPTDEPNSILIT